MYAYEQSHPWISFSINLTRAPAKLWALLGEVNMLCRNISGSPLMPAAHEEIVQNALARGIAETGEPGDESLNEDEIKRLLTDSLRVAPSRTYLAQEKKNILDGIRNIHSDIDHGVLTTLTPATIVDYNRMVLDRLVLPAGVSPGGYRTGDVHRPDRPFPLAPVEDITFLIENLCDWLNSKTFVPPPDMTVMYGILKAVFAHLYLAWIQPFQAGNIGTTRLLEYGILASAGIPDVAANLLGVHYAGTRNEYQRQIGLASAHDGKVVPFVMYSVRGYRDQLRKLATEINRHQAAIIWEHFIHVLFRDKTSPADLRRRELALEISRLSNPVPIPVLKDMTPSLARAYATKTYKTLTRDVNDLLKLGLIKKTEDGIFSQKSRIMAFLRRRA